MPDALYGARQYAEVLYAEGQAGAVPVFRSVEYIFELRQPDGTRLAILPYWKDGTWTEELNRPDRLTFSYPAHESICSSFTGANEVWLKDGENSYVTLQKFRITGKTTRGITDESVVVRGESLLGQLREEFITTYSQDAADGKTHRQLVNAYLSFQDKTRKIYPGVIAMAWGDPQREAWVTNKRVLDALHRLQETVGGDFWVTPERRLNWLDNRSTKFGQQIRRGKQMKGISVEVDYAAIVNRLYAYGKGVDRNARLNLIDAGEANEYIDDGGSQGTYGKRAGVYTNTSIEEAATLLSIATDILDAQKDPVTRYTVDAIDISQDRRIERDFEALELGSTVDLIDEVLGISTTQKVVGLTRDLETTLNIKVQLTNRQGTLEQIIAKILRKVEDSELSDTVEISTDTPQDISLTGGGTPGTTGEVSDGGHIHDLDYTGFDPGPGGADILSNDNPQSLGAVDPGTDTDVSRDDHVHPIPKYT